MLINSVGTPTGSAGPALASAPYDRPTWGYGLHIARELFWSRSGCRVLGAIREDLVHNVVANPLVMVEIGPLDQAVGPLERGAGSPTRSDDRATRAPWPGRSVRWKGHAFGCRRHPPGRRRRLVSPRSRPR